jgi:muramoyltetrapeptide carboxypeptidase
MKELVVPAPVVAGAHIRIISPAMPTVASLPMRARRGEQALQAMGFTLSYGRFALDDIESATDPSSASNRAQDLIDAFEDPTVDAVLSADAGDRTDEILPFLDPAPFQANPKPFIGYCNNVFINQYLADAGLSSFYGCTLMTHLGEAGGAFPETLDGLARALARSGPLRCTPMPSRTGEYLNWYLSDPDNRLRRRSIAGGWTWLRPGRASGPLLGGELRLIPDMVRRFDMTLDSSVLFWHLAFKGPDPEVTFRKLVDRVDLTGLSAMIVGAHPTISPPEWAARVSDLIEELLPEVRYPIVANADISHLDPTWTVPYGEQVSVDSAGELVFPRGFGPA